MRRVAPIIRSSFVRTFRPAPHHIIESQQRGCERRSFNNCDSSDNDDSERRRFRIRRRVVVTGLGAITPLGFDMQSTWEGVLRSSTQHTGSFDDGCGITSLYHALQHQDLSPPQFEKEWAMLQLSSCQVAASVRNDWITNHPSRTVAEGDTSAAPWLDGRTSRFVQLALIAADEAIRHSGLNDYLKSQTATLQSESYGVCIGNGMSSTRDIILSSTQDLRKISPHFVPRILPNSPSARVAIHNRLRGPNLSHTEACAAGAAAIAQAVELIQLGKVNGMVAGGCESAVEAIGLGGFGKLRALSDNKLDGNEDHASAQASSRPFDTKRNGFVLAEGAAMLVLEEYNHAIVRGAPILAEIIGVGYSGDAFHITAPEPTGEGAARAMHHALEDSGNGISMDDVDYVNAHATSTPMGDVAEINAIRMALSRTASGGTKHVTPLLVSSTKGATGHLLGAAGSLEAALTVRAVLEDRVPHTRNLDAISEDIVKALGPTIDDATSRRSIQLVQHEPITQTIKIAMSNSFGFGGTNVSLLFRKVK